MKTGDPSSSCGSRGAVLDRVSRKDLSRVIGFDQADLVPYSPITEQHLDEVIREELVRVVEQRAATDPHLHHLDGIQLYGEADSGGRPLPDALHPDAETHQLVGDRFAELVFGGGGAFS